jgi:hypothetical protein
MIFGGLMVLPHSHVFNFFQNSTPYKKSPEIGKKIFGKFLYLLDMKYIITESSLTSSVEKILDHVVQKTQKIVFPHVNIGETQGIIKIKIHDVRYGGKNDDGTSNIDVDILIEQFLVRDPEDETNEYFEEDPSMIPGLFLLLYESDIQDKVANFMPNVYLTIHFLDPDDI